MISLNVSENNTDAIEYNRKRIEQQIHSQRSKPFIKIGEASTQRLKKDQEIYFSSSGLANIKEKPTFGPSIRHRLNTKAHVTHYSGSDLNFLVQPVANSTETMIPPAAAVAK